RTIADVSIKPPRPFKNFMFCTIKFILQSIINIPPKCQHDKSRPILRDAGILGIHMQAQGDVPNLGKRFGNLKPSVELLATLFKRPKYPGYVFQKRYFWPG